MLRDGFLRFCDDPELACCRAEAELGQLRIENVRLRAELQELVKARAEARISPVKCPCDASEEAQELMNAKADGRLVVLLPIDTEVFIVQDGEILGFRIYEYSLFSTNNLNIRYWSECITDDDEDDLDFWADDIGKTVFLTEMEAKEVLKCQK